MILLSDDARTESNRRPIDYKLIALAAWLVRLPHLFVIPCYK